VSFLTKLRSKLKNLRFPKFKLSLPWKKHQPEKILPQDEAPKKQRWQKWLPIVLPAMFGIALADVTTDVLYFLLHDLPNKISVTVPYQAPSPMVTLKRSFVTDLVSNNILDHTNTVPGQAASKGMYTTLDPANAVRSKLSYKLMGTIVFSEARRGIATFSKGKDVKSYLQGEQLQPGYTVWGVERGNVYLHDVNKNSLEYIKLSIDLDEKGSKGLASGKSRGRTLKDAPKEIKQVSDDKFTVERSFVKEKLKNIQDLLSQAKAAPTGDGWKITNIAEDSIFEYVGLQPGDVITGVNGKEIKTQADAVMLFNQFQSGSQNTIQLQLKREGQDKVMTYELK
jgi:type II secretory pathway component PulC